jgi:hypothetical protein
VTQTGRRNFQLSARNRDEREPQKAEPDPLERLEFRRVLQRHENEEGDPGKSGGKVAKAMTKGNTIAGKLLTTPSRLFKLLIPLTTINRKGISPVAVRL